MNKHEKEVRNLEGEFAEVRVIGTGRNIVGYGIVFNRESRDLGGFTEIIKPSAMNNVIPRSDIFALMNHNQGRGVLARSLKGKGSMTLETDTKGVKYMFEAPAFDLGNELIEGIRRGDIRASSFGFTVAKGGDSFTMRKDGTVLRTITQFNELYDMSPAYREAYQDTTIAVRNIEAFKETNPVISEDIKTDIDEPIPDPIIKPVEKRELSDKERFTNQLINLFKHSKK